MDGLYQMFLNIAKKDISKNGTYMQIQVCRFGETILKKEETTLGNDYLRN